MHGETSQFDILIVGGGLVGSAAAWHLARLGLKVLLIERGHLNAGASGQNAGSLHFQIERRFLEQGEQAAADGARIVSLNRLAIADWRGLEDLLARPLDIAMHGGLMVAETEADMALLAFKVERENALGLPSQMLDGAALRERAPCLSPALAGAAWLAGEGHANPRILVDAFATGAQGRGAVIRVGTALKALTMARDGTYQAVLDGPDGETRVRVPRILLAAGHWVPRLAGLLGLNVPLYPAPLMMSVTDRAAPTLPFLIQHGGKRLSMKQTEDGNFLIGGGWPSRLARRADGSPDLDSPPLVEPANLRANLEVARRVMPAIAGQALLRTWTGMTCISADQLPIVGEVPAAPGLFVAAGGSLFTLGPTLARLLAQTIADGAAPEELAMFTPRRFAHLDAFAVLP
ncbi:NAD(P)/FAD-dependent oxidoreductase [Novosphingobium sp. Leaf2]|uniref:NAD(P)/FAD-dependent oxidoreductase n=1 Tax=Novosphingobium sp. Leaf2 TaxID=1735670 RepID=UPI0006F9A83B|nr:FAD-binding oxidoreductase [Novosphingobium sp. Leaf2]KQM18457.1 FAD-dependent oxidoreductase [Novosphingobium sp. Leaf2]